MASGEWADRTSMAAIAREKWELAESQPPASDLDEVAVRSRIAAAIWRNTTRLMQYQVLGPSRAPVRRSAWRKRRRCSEIVDWANSNSSRISTADMGATLDELFEYPDSRRMCQHVWRLQPSAPHRAVLAQDDQPSCIPPASPSTPQAL